MEKWQWRNTGTLHRHILHATYLSSELYGTIFLKYSGNTLWSQYYCYTFVIDEKIEAQSLNNWPKFTQTVNGRAEIQTHIHEAGLLLVSGPQHPGPEGCPHMALTSNCISIFSPPQELAQGKREKKNPIIKMNEIQLQLTWGNKETGPDRWYFATYNRMFQVTRSLNINCFFKFLNKTLSCFWLEGNQEMWEKHKLRNYSVSYHDFETTKTFQLNSWVFRGTYCV